MPDSFHSYLAPGICSVVDIKFFIKKTWEKNEHFENADLVMQIFKTFLDAIYHSSITSALPPLLICVCAEPTYSPPSSWTPSSQISGQDLE